jgi:hypothetical protein
MADLAFAMSSSNPPAGAPMSVSEECRYGRRCQTDSTVCGLNGSDECPYTSDINVAMSAGFKHGEPGGR